MTEKETIVGRLIDTKVITFEEALLLLEKETVYIQPYSNPSPVVINPFPLIPYDLQPYRYPSPFDVTCQDNKQQL